MSKADSIRILYIEDDIITATRVQMQLDQRGYVVDLAMDGKEGLAKIEEQNYDVVAVDYHLPGMNGLQVLQNLANNPFKMPAIMVTGAGNERVAVEAMKLGAGDYLVKDTENHYLELLPSIIESELQKQRLITEKQQAENALHYRDTILEAVSFAAQKFLVANHWQEPIQEILAHLGQAVAASRVYIFENHSQNIDSQTTFSQRYFSDENLENLLTSQRYEWVADGIKSQIHEPNLQNMPYYPHFQNRAKTLAKGQPIYGLTKNFLEPERELLTMGKVLSIAIVPVFVNKKWWGFIGYDDCLEEREWPSVVIEAFKTAASLLGAAIQRDKMNKALRKSEKRLAETQRLANLGHCEWDLFTNTRRLSQETLKIFGWNSNKSLIKNETFIKAIHPQDRHIVKEATHQAIYFNKFYDIEFRIIRPDGSIRYLHALSELIRDSQGKPRRFLGTAQDITAYKEVEMALRDSTQTLSAILNAATDSIVMMELDTTCVIINPAGAERLGRKVAEVVGQRLCDLVAKDVAIKRKKIVKQLIRTKQPSRFEDEESPGLWFEHSIYPVFNESGTVNRIAIVSRDISERKQAEEALKHERDFTNAIINTAGSLVMVLDHKGRIVRFNDTCSNLTGYTFEEVKNRYIWDFLLTDEKIEPCKQYFKNIVAKSPTSQRYEVNWIMKNKTLRLIDWSHTILTNEHHEVDYVIGTGIDITERKRAEEILARTLTELEIILDNSPVGIAFLAQKQQFIRVNRKLEEMCGYTEQELKNHTPKILYFSPKDYQTLNKNLSATYEMEQLMRRKDNTSFWCHVKVKEIDPNDPAKGFIWSLEDVTEKRQAEENLRLAATVFETTTEAILVTDTNNHIIMVNPAFTTITGYRFDEVVDKTPHLLSSGRHNAEFYQQMWTNLLEEGKWQGEIWNRRKNGEIYVQWISITTIRDANHQIVQYVAVFRDITKRKKNEELILHQAHHDALTNLPNRILFVDRLKQALRSAKRHQGRVAVMFIDLDRFKSVNDTLGHDFGDLLLKEVAQRLIACIRESDTVARLGGDEFTIVLTQIQNISDIQIIAKRMLNSLSQPFTLKDHETWIGGSIGIAFFPKDGQEAETLVKKADIAMYQAKQEGRNTFRFYGLA
jgi:diguanylate cyclase (GGDEF)-like protein/PAS domain S-box-containing protein